MLPPNDIDYEFCMRFAFGLLRRLKKIFTGSFHHWRFLAAVGGDIVIAGRAVRGKIS
jgi:hypothetical protein